MPCAGIYADDILVLADTSEDLQAMINICVKWTKKWRMSCNVKKSATIKFPALRSRYVDPPIYDFNGRKLPAITEYKYLGVYFDTKLKFETQFEKKKAAAKKSLGLISKFLSSSDAPWAMKKQVIDSIVLQGATYGLQFWGWDKQKELEDIISDSAKTIAQVKYKKRASPDASRAIAGLKPLDIRMKQLAKKQLKGISELDNDRPSNKTWREDYRPDSIRNRVANFPTDKKQVEALCQQARLTDLHKIRNSHPYTRVGNWNSNKEGECGNIRNYIRCGCDTFSMERKRLDSLKEGPEVMHCPLCNAKGAGVPQHHPYTDCHVTQEELHKLAFDIRTHDGQHYVPHGGPKEMFSQLLTPDNWDTKSNAHINNWCHRIDTLISNHLATSNQPSLAKFINVKDKTLPTLNSNIIGQVFSVDMGGHDDWPGHRRVRITEYNALDDMHDFDTTQLDICDTSQSFFAGEDLELNKMLRNGQLTHIPAEDVVLLHQNIVEVQLGYIYTDNVVGRTMRMKLPSDKRTSLYYVDSCDHSNRADEHHIIIDKSSRKHKVDLNRLHAEGAIPHPPFFAEVLSRLRLPPLAFTRSQRPSCEVDAERYDRHPP